jgi:hypothetical protein
MPDSITSIGDGAFSDARELTTVALPERLTKIGNVAFANCVTLTNVILPDTLEFIGKYAFNGCAGLSKVTFNGTIDQWNAISKGDFWISNVPATYIQCSDGQVTL